MATSPPSPLQKTRGDGINNKCYPLCPIACLCECVITEGVTGYQAGILGQMASSKAWVLYEPIGVLIITINHAPVNCSQS